MELIVGFLVVFTVVWATAVLHRIAGSLDDIRDILIEMQEDETRQTP